MVSIELIILAPIMIIIANLLVYIFVGIFGKRISGEGVKFEPFAGGEEAIPPRGLYQSELYIFSVLFMVVEAFVLLLSSSFTSPSNYIPLLFLIGGSGVILSSIWWFLIVGGGRL